MVFLCCGFFIHWSQQVSMASIGKGSEVVPSTREHTLKILLNEPKGLFVDDLVEKIKADPGGVGVTASQVESLLKNLARNNLVFNLNLRWYHGCFVGMLDKFNVDDKSKAQILKEEKKRLAYKHKTETKNLEREQNKVLKNIMRDIEVKNLDKKIERLNALAVISNYETTKILNDVVGDLNRIAAVKSG